MTRAVTRRISVAGGFLFLIACAPLFNVSVFAQETDWAFGPHRIQPREALRRR